MTRRRLSSSTMRVRALWRQNPCCHWCGRPTRLMRPPSSSADAGEASPALFSPPLPIGTVDHLYSHYHPRRSRKKHAGSTTVLACKECNAERCRKENLVFRGFVRTLARLGLVPETNRRKLLAFRTALAVLESPEVLPEKLDGQDLALRFVRRTDIEPGLHGQNHRHAAGVLHGVSGQPKHLARAKDEATAGREPDSAGDSRWWALSGA